jgi:cytochrome c
MMASRTWGPLLVLIAALGCAITAAVAQTVLDEQGGPVKGVAVAPDGKHALIASFDYSIILRDLPKEKALAHLYGHEAVVNDVVFLQGERALSASDDGTVGLWDLHDQKLITRLNGHRGKVAAVAVSPDRQLVASAG